MLLQLSIFPIELLYIFTYILTINFILFFLYQQSLQVVKKLKLKKIHKKIVKPSLKYLFIYLLLLFIFIYLFIFILGWIVNIKKKCMMQIQIENEYKA